LLAILLAIIFLEKKWVGVGEKNLEAKSSHFRPKRSVANSRLFAAGWPDGTKIRRNNFRMGAHCPGLG
jgi:hypothetical protein